MRNSAGIRVHTSTTICIDPVHQVIRRDSSEVSASFWHRLIMKPGAGTRTTGNETEMLSACSEKSFCMLGRFGGSGMTIVQLYCGIAYPTSIPSEAPKISSNPVRLKCRRVSRSSWQFVDWGFALGGPRALSSVFSESKLPDGVCCLLCFALVLFGGFM